MDNSAWEFPSEALQLVLTLSTMLTHFFSESCLLSLTVTGRSNSHLLHYALLLGLSCTIIRQSRKFESNLGIIELTTGKTALAITCAITLPVDHTIILKLICVIT